MVREPCGCRSVVTVAVRRRLSTEEDEEEMPDVEEDLLAGRYRAIGPVGCGGFGVVW